jgi:small subunit ribosomal protein S16
MLKIRLTRTGKKKQASYRVVVADKDSKRDGRIVERIGYYNPLPNPAEYRIKEERALYWLSMGAQATDAVRILLEKQGTYGRLVRLNAGESLETLVAEFGGTPPVAETVVAPAAPVVEMAEQPTEEPAEVELAAEEATVAEVVDETAEEVAAVEAEEPAEVELAAEEPAVAEAVAETAEDSATAEEVEMVEAEEMSEAPEMSEAEDTTIEPEVAEAKENE